MRTTLFEKLKSGEEISTLVNSWVRHYNRNNREGRLELVHFIMHTAGCTAVVPRERLSGHPNEWKHFIQLMTPRNGGQHGDQDLANVSIPLNAPGQQSTAKRVKEFIQILISEIQPEILFDNCLMDGLIKFLKALSSSHLRSFRYTSTLTAATVLTSLANVFLGLNLDSDSDSDSDSESQQRVPEDVDQRAQAIEDMIRKLYEEAYIYRTKDIRPKIRILCIKGLIDLMILLPDCFLTLRHLRFIAIAMNDTDAIARLTCMKEVNKLYSDRERAEQMQNFTRHVKKRVLEMTRHSDWRIGEQAVKLVSQMYKYAIEGEPLFTEGEKNEVYVLVYCCRRPVGVAAGEFLFSAKFRYENQSTRRRSSSSRLSIRTRRSGIRNVGSENGINVIDLLRFHTQNRIHEHVTHLVDSVWEIAKSILTDWEYITHLLLGTQFNEREQLNPDEQTIVVEFLLIAVKRVFSGMPPEGRLNSSRKTSLTKSADLEREELLSQSSNYFLLHLPVLIEKYLRDDAKLVMLIQIPRFLELKIYISDKICLTRLLKLLSTIFDTSTDPAVLEQISMTFRTLADHSHIGIGTMVHLVAVAERWTAEFNNAKAGFCAAEGTDDDSTNHVTDAILRVFSLYLYNNLLQRVTVLPDVQLQFDFAVPEKLMVFSLKLEFIMLKCKSNNAEEIEPLDIDEVEEIHQQAHTFYRRCIYLLSFSMQSMVKEASYSSLCDYLFIYGLLGASENLLSPITAIPSCHQESLVNYVITNVCESSRDDTADRKSQSDVINHHRALLSGIFKLIKLKLIDHRTAAPIFHHEVRIRFQTEYGDIIKETVKYLEVADPKFCGCMLATILFTFYENSALNLAQKLATHLTYMLDIKPAISRHAVAELHRSGLKFVFSDFNASRSSENLDAGRLEDSPCDLNFLSVLQKTSPRVQYQDGKKLNDYLNKLMDPTWHPDRKEFAVILKYKASLNKSHVASETPLQIPEEVEMYRDPSTRNRTSPVLATERQNGGREASDQIPEELGISPDTRSRNRTSPVLAAERQNGGHEASDQIPEEVGISPDTRRRNRTSPVLAAERQNGGREASETSDQINEEVEMYRDPSTRNRTSPVLATERQNGGREVSDQIPEELGISPDTRSRNRTSPVLAAERQNGGHEASDQIPEEVGISPDTRRRNRTSPVLAAERQNGGREASETSDQINEEVEISPDAISINRTLPVWAADRQNENGGRAKKRRRTV